MNVDFPDLQGNTPLHYAAKYGHPDLCKVLIDRGSFAGIKNNQGQTAYDLCGSPSVRQYLQPEQFSGNASGDIYCQTQGHMMGNSNYPMSMQPIPYSTEQPLAYTKPAEHPASLFQEQQTYPAAVQISPAPIVQCLAINQSNSISTPASPLITGNNQPMNVHANMFGRNEISLPKTLANTQDHNSGQSSNSGPPSFNTLPVRQCPIGIPNFPSSSPHHPSPNKALQATPQQLPPQTPHQQLPIPQVTHQSPHKQIHIVPPQQIHQAPPQQIHQVPQQQIHQVPPQQIHQVPPQQIHNQIPNNFNSGFYPGSSPPISQALPPPPTLPSLPQNYKPAAGNGSLSRIIQPGLFCLPFIDHFLLYT